MNVQELFQDLSHGELSNLSIGTEGSGAIEEFNQPKVILYVNEALTRLYAKFVLSSKTIFLEMVENIVFYHLDPKFSETGWDKDVTDFPYIKDLGKERFEGDVIKVTEVYDNWGRELPVNDPEKPLSVFTPQNKVLQVPYSWNGQVLSVTYQAKHHNLNEEELDQVVEIPSVLEEALRAYVAYKIYGNMNTQESIVVSQQHLARFDEICAHAVEFDLVNSSYSPTNTVFNKRGWV